MTQPSRMVWLGVFAAAVLLLPGMAAAQSGTVTDDGFVSSNAATQQLNLNGNGLVLIVAGSSATVGPVPVGLTKSYIKFDLTSSLPPNTSAANVVKATLKLFISPSCNASGAFDIYPITTAWTESTLSAASPPSYNSTPINASPIPVGKAESFMVIDLTEQVQDWLEASTVSGSFVNLGIALVPSTSATYVVFDSRKNIVTSEAPRLEIVLANAGAQGPTGPQGPQGPTGSAGPAGTAATVTVGKTTTGAPGTPALVTNAGSSSAALLNFVIPQGPTGATGPQGAVGPVGQTGPQGIQGPQGPTGQAGTQGLPGAPGATGPAGPSGPVGINNRNMWVSGTAYIPNDAVSYNSSFWLATAVDNGSQPPPGNSNWQLLAAGINNRGAWNAANSYNVNDVVFDSLSGSSWLAVQPIPANTPNSEPSPTNTSWQFLAEQGAAGATGPAGPQGPSGPTGATGPAGSAGGIGPAGPVGPQGPQGAQGPPGSPANLSNAPLFFTTFFGGTLTGNSYAAGKIVPDDPITVTRVTANVQSPGSPSCTPAVLRLSNAAGATATAGSGVKGQDVYLPGSQTEVDSGAGSLTFPAGTTIRASLRSAPACASGTGAPSNANVVVEYRTQNATDTDACPSGEATCSGICENTSIDPNNCGTCGTNCLGLPNTLGGSCTNGTCGVTCASGFGDCDHNPSNGCETNLQNTLADCGACGAVCTIANGTPQCSSGQCTAANCNAGLTNCTSACSNLTTDTNNCGACGQRCGLGGSGTATCNNGSCQFACSAGYSLCDQSVFLDCGGAPCSPQLSCVNLQNDNCNCGGCPAASGSTFANTCGSCAAANGPGTGTDVCIAGKCINPITCPAGQTQCSATTCVSLSSDINNCGGCGNVCSPSNPCQAPACISGTCSGNSLPDGTSCGTSSVCLRGQCLGAIGTPCQANAQCLSGACVLGLCQ